MKKFKIISTCASLLLMVALLVFGVYAATSVSFGISSTVSFKCENVFVKVAAGKGDTVPADVKYYYSMPTQEQIDNKLSLDDMAKDINLGNFVDNDDGSDSTISCYLTVTNLHGRKIYVAFDYEWISSSKYNATKLNEEGAVKAVAVLKSKIGENAETRKDYNAENKTTPTAENGLRKDDLYKYTGSLGFEIGETKTFVISLIYKNAAMVYKLDKGTLKIKMNAALDTITNIDQNDTTQGN